jgi:hypothetical protein
VSAVVTGAAVDTDSSAAPPIFEPIHHPWYQFRQGSREFGDLESEDFVFEQR